MLLTHIGTIRFHRASVVTGRSFHWCFDGSFVALFPGTVHSPRHDDLHGRERDQIYLRRRHRPPGVGKVPEPTHRTADPPQSRTGAGRSLYGRHVRGRERLDRGRARDPARSARHGAALGPAAMVAALSRPAHQAVQSGAAGRETTSPIITISTGGSIRSSSTPTSNTAAPISKRRTRTLDDAQLAKKRHLAAKLLIGRGDPRARHRFGLGRPWPLSGRNDRRRCHRHYAVDGAIAGLERPRGGEEPDRLGEIPVAAIIATFRVRSTGSCRSACSNMSASASTKPFSGDAPICSATTASWCCTRSAARPGPT